jgi:hypothetical protein
MNIRLVVLTTGEQLLTTVTEQTETSVTITKPSIIIPAGKGELGLMPWLPYTNIETTGVTLKASHVVCVVEPRVELANHYSSMFGNGIVIPDSSIATPELKLAT